MFSIENGEGFGKLNEACLNLAWLNRQMPRMHIKCTGETLRHSLKFLTRIPTSAPLSARITDANQSEITDFLTRTSNLSGLRLSRGLLEKSHCSLIAERHRHIHELRAYHISGLEVLAMHCHQLETLVLSGHNQMGCEELIHRNPRLRVVRLRTASPAILLRMQQLSDLK